MPIRHQRSYSKNKKAVLMGGASAAAVTAVAGMSDQALAQLDELVVTAQKREQSLQSVPLAVQAFSSEDIQRQGLDNFDDYLKRVPSMSVGATAPGATTIVFRGAVAQPTGFDTISSSTVYLDEQPITKDGQNPDPRLIDIERVEILPGPQPTIYGASSQSGTLKIGTNKPDTSEFSAFIDVSGSAVQKGGLGYDVNAMVNVPIVQDKLAIRLVGFYAEEPGYIDNVLATIDGGRSNANVVKEDVNRAV